MSERKPQILFVDDEALSRRLVVRALRKFGFDVAECGNASEALGIMRAARPDLVLLDSHLPDMNGAQLCQRIRSDSDPDVAQTPIILLTGQGGEEEELHGLEAGANDFVSKPVGPMVLKARIDTHVRLRAMQQRLQEQNEELERWQASLQRDLEAARLAQQALMPQKLPAIPGWEVATLHLPVMQVGGDIYDWFRLHDGRYFFCITDATGHGPAAALQTAMAKLLFRRCAAGSASSSEILRAVNRDFFSVFRGRSIMTSMCVTLDPDTGAFTVAGAGHPPLLVRLRGGRIEKIASSAPPLGVGAEISVSETTHALAPLEMFLLYTDGFYGMLNAAGERLEPAAVGLLLAQTPASASESLQQLVARLREYHGMDAFPDDLAAIAVARVR